MQSWHAANSFDRSYHYRHSNSGLHPRVGQTLPPFLPCARSPVCVGPKPSFSSLMTVVPDPLNPSNTLYIANTVTSSSLPHRGGGTGSGLPFFEKNPSSNKGGSSFEWSKYWKGEGEKSDVIVVVEVVVLVRDS